MKMRDRRRLAALLAAGLLCLGLTVVNEGDSFLLQDGVFVQAEREKTMNDHVYSDNVDVCIRAYTSGESE